MIPRPCVAFFLVGCVLAIGVADAQQPPRPEFEVASVKPGDSSPQFIDSGIKPGGLYTATNLTLKELIAQAYGAPGYEIFGGPGWLDSDRFMIEARADRADSLVPAADSTQRINLMLQGLLESRFALRVHKENRERNVYELVVAKSGPRLTTGDATKSPRLSAPRGKVTATSVTIPFFVRFLSGQLRRTVVDMTGLTGKYDFVLNYTRDRGDSAVPGTQADPDAPSIFTALEEQLGLRLVSSRAPAEVLVVDRAEKPQPN